VYHKAIFFLLNYYSINVNKNINVNKKNISNEKNSILQIEYILPISILTIIVVGKILNKNGDKDKKSIIDVKNKENIEKQEKDKIILVKKLDEFLKNRSCNLNEGKEVFNLMNSYNEKYNNEKDCWFLDYEKLKNLELNGKKAQSSEDIRSINKEIEDIWNYFDLFIIDNNLLSELIKASNITNLQMNKINKLVDSGIYDKYTINSNFYTILYEILEIKFKLSRKKNMKDYEYEKSRFILHLSKLYEQWNSKRTSLQEKKESIFEIFSLLREKTDKNPDYIIYVTHLILLKKKEKFRKKIQNI
jgi:hypothetical protein